MQILQNDFKVFISFRILSRFYRNQIESRKLQWLDVRGRTPEFFKKLFKNTLRNLLK